MEVIAEFTAAVGMRHQFTIPSTVRKLLAAKGKSLHIGDPVIIQIIDIIKKGEGLEMSKDDDISANKPRKDNGGESE